MHNTLCLDSEEITFPVKHYEFMFDLLTNMPRLFEPSIKANFIRIFGEDINKYQEEINYLFSSRRGENSIVINENLVSYFPARVYNVIEDLAETILNPANCRTFLVLLHTKDNVNFTQHEPLYVYTDMIKPDLVGDTYMRLLTPLHFPSDKGYHRFDYPLYKLVEQSFIESIPIRLVMKTGVNVWFEDSDIQCLVILHF